MIHALSKDIWIHGWFYLKGWIASYSRPILPAVYWAYGVAFVSAFIVDTKSAELSMRTRLGLIVASFASFLATSILLYLTCSPIASKVVNGVQGRYFVGILPAVALSALGILQPKISKLPFWFFAVPLSCSILLFLTIVVKL
jgi:uncharacterized membrane protein